MKTHVGMVLLAAACLGLGGLCYGDAVYWYVDDNGVTHFGSEPVGDGDSSGVVDYQEVPDDSIVTSPGGGTTTVINSSQFGDGTYRHPGEDSAPKERPRVTAPENTSIVKDRRELVNLSNRPVRDEDLE